MKIINVMTYLLKCLLLVEFAKAQLILALKTCSDNLLNCPSNSLCTEITGTGNNNKNSATDTLFKCVCLENFHLNPSWLEYENLNASTFLVQEHYCVAADELPKTKGNKLLTYIRSPARKEHLAFGILMVLFAAALVTAILYGLKVLNPVKRTKSIYKKFKYKRQNIIPLQEMDELDLNRRYEMQTL